MLVTGLQVGEGALGTGVGPGGGGGGVTCLQAEKGVQRLPLPAHAVVQVPRAQIYEHIQVARLGVAPSLPFTRI